MALDSMSYIVRGTCRFIFAIVPALVSCCLHAQTPALSVAGAKVGITSNQNGAAPNFEFFMDPAGYPRTVTQGETVVTMGTWPNGNNPTFSDDKSNTWTAVTNCLDSSNLRHGFFYAVNAAAGTSTITETHSSAIQNTVFDWAHFYNMATSGSLDGSSCTNGVTPANNTVPNISGTTYSTTAGDLILTCVYVEQGSLGTPNAISSITSQSGFTLLSEDTTYGHSCAYGIAAGGSFTPSYTVAQGTHNSFTIMSAAFKSGTGGTAPPSGAAIALSEMHYASGSGQTDTVNLPCPSGTSAVAVLGDAGAITNVTDSGSSTWGHVTVSPPYWGPIYYANNPTISNPNTYKVTITYGSTGGWDLDGLFCLVGTNGIDTAAKAQNGSTLTGANSGSTYATANVSGGTANDAPAIGTSAPGDLVLDVGAMGFGPVDSCQTGYCVFDYVGSTNWTAGDNSSYANGDMMAHVYVPTASTARFNFNIGSGSSPTLSGISLAFLSANTSPILPPSGLTAIVH